MMDPLTRNEISKLKNDQKNSSNELEHEKIVFKNELMGDMGKQMIEELQHPPKRSFWVGMRYRLRRKRIMRAELRKAKKIKKGGE